MNAKINRLSVFKLKFSYRAAKTGFLEAFEFLGGQFLVFLKTKVWEDEKWQCSIGSKLQTIRLADSSHTQ